MAGSKRGQRRNNRETGSYYERMAGVYLTEKGYEILEYNYRCRLGEIDIIARDGDYLVSVSYTHLDVYKRQVTGQR